ncbi:antitoxin YefM [Lewinella marina]|uniref:type II toxin-antitoxin system Phd/YefM family antitoxin n=1 Tax=Neolewinella marina TaxID=438751 RepID=UPI0014314EAE|nr:type II toxin-antitoxin system Phd/YefM family antitoxin [Neolewinella marina]NJB86751.1 antitoxin YefM [Neolewinella marina]
MEAITVSKFRSNMKHYLDLVEESSDTVIIPRSGKDREGVVLMSLSEYNALMETVHLKSSPENHRRLLEGMRQVSEGLTTVKSMDDLDMAR